MKKVTVAADLSTLAARLKYARKRKDLNQTQLGEACGMAQSSVSELETGKSVSMEGPTLIRAAHALGVRPSWLLFRWGAEKEQNSPEESELLAAWNRLGEDVKKSLLGAIKDLGKKGGEDAANQGGRVS